MPTDASQTLFATAFFHASGRAPNAWTLSEQSKIEMYARCMVVCYASLRRRYPSAHLALYVNRPMPSPYAEQLAALEVLCIACDERYVVDLAVANNFPGCLYTLDVIDHLARDGLPTGVSQVVLLDNDCVLRGDLDALFVLAQADGLVRAYDAGYPVADVANGHSRATLTLVLEQMQDRRAAAPIPLYGGEFYLLPATVLPSLSEHIRRIWVWMTGAGRPLYGGILTEEHVMSVALALLESPVLLVPPTVIKRVWTARNYNTVDGSEADIALWHLPAEKRGGLARLYRAWQRHGGFDRLDDEAFARLVDHEVRLARPQPPGPMAQLAHRLRGAARVLLTGRA